MSLLAGRTSGLPRFPVDVQPQSIINALDQLLEDIPMDRSIAARLRQCRREGMLAGAGAGEADRCPSPAKRRPIRRAHAPRPRRMVDQCHHPKLHRGFEQAPGACLGAALGVPTSGHSAPENTQGANPDSALDDQTKAPYLFWQASETDPTHKACPGTVRGARRDRGRGESGHQQGFPRACQAWT